MSKLEDLKEGLSKKLESIDVQKLSEQVKYARYLHDRIVPMINEVVMSASDKKSYEEAYKAVIDKLRAVHEKVAKEKQDAESVLLTSVGQRHLINDIMPTLEEVEAEYNTMRLKFQQEKVEEIAQKIETGEFDPDAPREVGTRPERIKNIRSAKATLFGESKKKDQED